MLHWLKAAALAAALSFTSLAPALAESGGGLFSSAPRFSLFGDRFQPRLGTRTERNRVSLDRKYQRQTVSYRSGEAAGTIIVDTGDKFLYLVLGNGKALRYGIGTARDGFEWSGTHRVTRMAEWPGWTPPAAMKKRQPNLPDYMPGGPNNPLGARALYLGSTLYRIHGTNEPWTIGGDVSSGCIRMVNDDVIDLYERVQIGAKVIVI